MTENEFRVQTDRIKSTFGKAAYSDERMRIMWNDVKSLPGAWFESLCSDLIASERQAPMPTAFSLAASDERERAWKKEKQKNANESKTAMKSLFGAEDITMLCKSINERIEGKMDDNAFTAFKGMFKDMPTPRVCCVICDDSGYVFRREEGNECVSRCVCKEGAMKPTGIPRMEAG